MKEKQSRAFRAVVLIALTLCLTALSSRIKADTGTCGGVNITLPFNDVMASPFFCQIAAAYYSGLTNGTTATTYNPTDTVTREQMAAFISRTLDQSLKRGNKRAITKKWFTPKTIDDVTLTTVGGNPIAVEFDGTDLWVAHNSDGTVMRIKPSDGRILETWTGAINARGLLVAKGKIFITGATMPSSLYMIDPSQPAGAVTTLSSNLGAGAFRLAFDGSRVWTSNFQSVSIISLNPVTVTTVSTGFLGLSGILYDGSNVWVADNAVEMLHKLNADGSIAQSIHTGNDSGLLAFDGTNIWVPNSGSHSITVVRVKDAQGNPLASAFVLATLTGNGLQIPHDVAFDGERMLVVNLNSVSLWKAADLTPLGNFPTTTNAAQKSACSDGLNFWIAMTTQSGVGKLARF